MLKIRCKKIQCLIFKFKTRWHRFTSIDLHHLNVNIRLFLFGKVVRPGEKVYILCVTFKSHTWKTTRWCCLSIFRNAHNSHILGRTFINLTSTHAGLIAANFSYWPRPLPPQNIFRYSAKTPIYYVKSMYTCYFLRYAQNFTGSIYRLCHEYNSLKVFRYFTK